MGAPTNQEIVQRYWQARGRHDHATVTELRHPDWTVEWPQTGELVRGDANDRRSWTTIRAVNRISTRHGSWAARTAGSPRPRSPWSGSSAAATSGGATASGRTPTGAAGTSCRS